MLYKYSIYSANNLNCYASTHSSISIQLIDDKKNLKTLLSSHTIYTIVQIAQCSYLLFSVFEEKTVELYEQ